MKVIENEKFTLLKINSNNFKEIVSHLNKSLKPFDNKNIIIHLTSSSTIDSEEFLLFLDIANQKKENGTSFVVVKENISADDLPENLNVVPTLVEAEDIIDMENIERELGF